MIDKQGKGKPFTRHSVLARSQRLTRSAFQKKGIAPFASLEALWLFFPALVFFFGCRSETPSLKPLDLHPYQIPLTILAPDSAVVQVKDYHIMRDITIMKGEAFNLQLFELISSSQDAAGEKLRQLATVREAPFFKEVIREDDTGFIYSIQPDSTAIEYDFRRIKLIGEKEIIFQTGLAGNFSLEEVTKMYEAVK